MRRIFLRLQRFHIPLPGFWCSFPTEPYTEAVSSAANAGFSRAKPAEYATVHIHWMWKFTEKGFRSRIRSATFPRSARTATMTRRTE